jgi:hypothetical protein
MKGKTKNLIITIAIILVIAIIAFFILTKKPVETDIEVSKCIGQNSVLYTRLGCSHCKTQEEMFGENYQYINSIDCFFEQEKCADITGTPTWIIKGEKYEGVQSIEKLRELTGC